jgi:hypothetical protein
MQDDQLTAIALSALEDYVMGRQNKWGFHTVIRYKEDRTPVLVVTDGLIQFDRGDCDFDGDFVAMFMLSQPSDTRENILCNNTNMDMREFIGRTACVHTNTDDVIGELLSITHILNKNEQRVVAIINVNEDEVFVWDSKLIQGTIEIWMTKED